MVTPKENDKWSKLLHLMPSPVVSLVSDSRVTGEGLLEESTYDYQSTLGSLPDKSLSRLEVPFRELDAEVTANPAWCLCEMPEGDYSRVRVFPDVERLVRYIGRLEGEEVSVWAFLRYASSYYTSYGFSGSKIPFGFGSGSRTYPLWW